MTTKILDTKPDAPATPAPDAIRKARTANTRRLAGVKAGPENPNDNGERTVSQLAAELHTDVKTIRNRAAAMGARLVGKTYSMSKEQADSIRANPPIPRPRRPKTSKRRKATPKTV